MNPVRSSLPTAPFLLPARYNSNGTVDDLILLQDSSEDAILAHLKQRYTDQVIYTYIGPVLVVLNPYQQLHYEDVSMYSMSLLPSFIGRQLHEVAPHPFAMAEATYSQLLRNFQDQALIITGESGSGKTEASKQIMAYLATVSTKSRKRRYSFEEKTIVSTTADNVRKVLLNANLMLEAFGNAQTIKNNNSSRFGKYMVLQANESGEIVGGYLMNYLLEKSRVVAQKKGERNFHIFYQLLAGATEEQKAVWDLLSPTEYRYLTHGDLQIDQMNDRELHNTIQENMKDIGLTSEEIFHLYQQVAAVLWLGNMVFSAAPDIQSLTEENPLQPRATSVVDSRETLATVARLLGLKEDVLEEMLLYRTLYFGQMNSNRSVQKVPFDPLQATKACDSLAKSLYDNLFIWLVHRINSTIVVGTSGSKKKTIGILDIYGFEVFAENGFEQLCINYVNESLQQLFISHTLRQEQEGYREENVTWQPVAFFDNQIVCDLIDNPKQPGILLILDEQCTIQSTTLSLPEKTTKLLERFHQCYRDHPHYTKPLIQTETFIIQHYAGKVEYSVENFIEANIDTLYRDLREGIVKSSYSFVSGLFTSRDAEEDMPSSTSSKLSISSERSKAPPSTSTQFREQVNTLVRELKKANPHYVRCLKPNETKASMTIDDDTLLHQIRYLGLPENLKVYRAGYCYRENYATFLQRFKMISPLTWPSPKQTNFQDAVSTLLTSPGVGIDPIEGTDEDVISFQQDSSTDGCFALGRTKVFIRRPRGLFALENLRLRALPRIVGILEKAYVRYKVRCKVFYFSAAHDDILASFKTLYDNCQDRKRRKTGANDQFFITALYEIYAKHTTNIITIPNRFTTELARQEHLVQVIFAQSYIRRWIERRRYRRLQHASTVFAAYWRGLAARRRMTSDEWARCRQATLGMRAVLERYMGQKRRRRNTLDRKFKGDYYDCMNDPHVQEVLASHQLRQVYFAALVKKLNQRFHLQERLIIMTEKYLLNIQVGKLTKKAKERRAIPLQKIDKLSLSPYQDNYLVLHVTGERDYVLEFTEKLELSQLLRDFIRKTFKREVTMNFSDVIPYEAYLGEHFELIFDQLDKSDIVAETLVTKLSRTKVRIQVNNGFLRRL